MKQKDAKPILIVLLLLFGFYLLVPETGKQAGNLDAASSNGLGAQKSPAWQKIEKSIDDHLKIERHDEEMRRDLTMIENQMSAPAIDNSKVDPLAVNPNEPIPLKLNGQDAAIKAYQDTLTKKNGSGPLTPEQRINNKLSRDEFERNYREAYEKEYIRAYVQNARKGGYDVKFNDKGEIVEVFEVDTGEPARFPQSVDDSGKKATAPVSH